MEFDDFPQGHLSFEEPAPSQSKPVHKHTYHLFTWTNIVAADNDHHFLTVTTTPTTTATTNNYNLLFYNRPYA